jgi:hypothetical protein
MKKTMRAVVLALLTLSAVSQANAGCLNMYNNQLRVCDQYYCPNGTFTCLGCYADALTDYYGCIEQQSVA